MSNTGIYSDKGQKLINNIVNNIEVAKKQLVELYGLSRDDIERNNVQEIESSICKIKSHLGTWNLDKEYKTFGDLCKYVEEAVMIHDCNKSFTYTKYFCNQNDIDFESLKSRLDKYGVYCDCMMENARGKIPDAEII